MYKSFDIGIVDCKYIVHIWAVQEIYGTLYLERRHGNPEDTQQDYYDLQYIVAYYRVTVLVPTQK